MNFIEIVGGASTSAKLGGNYIGRNVNAVAYSDGDDIILTLESNSTRVVYARTIRMRPEEYQQFKHGDASRPLFVRGIELFGAEVLL